MAYSDFTLDRVTQDFNLKVRVGTLFAELGRVPPPAWLVECLARFRPMAFQSEKSRNEFIVAPILVACRELLDDRVYIYSGMRLDVDPARGLQGECDFALAYTPTTPMLEAPFLMVVEAKRENMEQGMGQCAAQLLAARLFNERRQREVRSIFGCVTIGELWQFIKLEADEILVHPDRLYLRDLEQLLWATTTILKTGIAQATEKAA